MIDPNFDCLSLMEVELICVQHVIFESVVVLYLNRKLRGCVVETLEFVHFFL